MGAADGKDLGTGFSGSRAPQSPEKRNFFHRRHRTEGFAGHAKTFAKPSHGFCAKKLQIERTPPLEPRMLRFLDDHPTASLWLIAIGQGSFMFGFNVALRALLV